MRAIGVMLLTVWAVAGWCAERHSNGLGGGRWSDPGSWHGGTLPAPTDVVVVASGDVLVFDGGAEAGPACAGILVDPRGVLTLQVDERPRVLRVAGPIEAYGSIRIDATRAPRARLEIRIETDEAENRAIRLHRQAALLLYGTVDAQAESRRRARVAREGELAVDEAVAAARQRARDARVAAEQADETARAAAAAAVVALDSEQGATRAAEAAAARQAAWARAAEAARAAEEEAADAYGRRPVILAAAAANGEPAPGVLTAGPDTQVDLMGVRVADFAVQVTGLDNTGFKATERLNLVNSLFDGWARVELKACDSARVAGNRFRWDGAEPPPAAALTLSGCKLTEVTENEVRGRYPFGLLLHGETDGALSSNRVAGARTGIAAGSSPNLMMRANRVDGAEEGLRLTAGSGAIEAFQARGCRTGVILAASRVQLADASIEETPEDGVPLLLDSSPVVLLNCALPADGIRTRGAPPANREPWATAMHYLVVKVTGRGAAGTEVQVRTAAASGGVPDGLADLNVRNSPARVGPNGLTPLPRTLRPLVVRGWRLDADGTRRDPPFYDLEVLGEPDLATGVRPVLKRQIIEPRETWQRADPNAAVPTLEVKL